MVHKRRPFRGLPGRRLSGTRRAPLISTGKHSSTDRRRARRAGAAGRGGRRAARRRRDRAVHRALSQGSDRRARRHAAAHARGAAELSARARGAARRRSSSRSASRASSTPRSRRRSWPPTARAASRTSICRTSRSAAPRREIATEAGLEPLADLLLTHPAARSADRGRGLRRSPTRVSPTSAAALDGARAILIERFAEDADLIGALREQMWTNGRARVEACARARKRSRRQVQRLLRLRRAAAKLPSHRVLALFRGEKEEILDLHDASPTSPDDRAAPSRRRARTSCASCSASASPTAAAPATRWLRDTVRWAWRTKIHAASRRSICALRLWTAAEEEAVRVFAANLRDLLLAAPAGARVDDGPRPRLSHRREGRGGRRHRQGGRDHRDLSARAAAALGRIAARRWPSSAREHSVELIAIGNGTASRETDKLAPS